MSAPSLDDERRVARGVAARLSIVAILWTWAAARLAFLGWPWALSAGGAPSALAVTLGLLVGVFQGWFIARRSGARIVRWSREAATARSRDVLLVVRGILVIGVFATLGLTLKHYLLATHPVVVGGVYVLASTSLVVAAAGLARLAWREGAAGRPPEEPSNDGR